MPVRKRDILAAAKAAGLFALARQRTAGGIRILGYHGLWLGADRFPGDPMFMQAATFKRRLELIRREGYPVVTLQAAIDALRGHGDPLPPAAVVITIDDGWFSTYSGMLPVLEAHGMPATLYCDTAQLLGGLPIAHVMARYLERIAELTPSAERANPANIQAVNEARATATDMTLTMDQRLDATRQLAVALGIAITPYLDARVFAYMTSDELRDAHARGLDVQLHTHRHTLGTMSEPVITEEIRLNQHHLGAILGKPPANFSHFCYPSGIAGDNAARVLAGLNLESSTTTGQGIAQRGMPMHLLPRMLDGEHMSEIEFEAELSGFADWAWQRRRSAKRSASFVLDSQTTTDGRPLSPLVPKTLRSAIGTLRSGIFGSSVRPR